MRIDEFNLKYLEEVTTMHGYVLDGWSMKSLISDIANNYAKSYVAIQNDEVVGFCSFLVTGDAELNFICTKKGHERQGVATFLLTKTIEQINVETFVLEVRTKNENAISLYEKLGFKKLGIRKDFYQSPSDDAIVMGYLKEKES